MKEVEGSRPNLSLDQFENPSLALKEWLIASGRQFVVLNAEDLDALSFPDGIEALQFAIGQYREKRATRKWYEKDGEVFQQDDRLTREELYRLLAWATDQLVSRPE